MKWDWITLLFMLQNVISLELEASSVPAMSIKKINRGRHKPSRIPNYPMESAVNSESLPESFFPDVVYPTTILDAAQPFYYSQHGYDEVLGPFSNDIKSSYKTLAAVKESNPSIDITASLLTDHKNTIQNDTSDTTVNESYIYSSCLEDDPGKSEQNNTYIIVNETVLENSTLYHKDQQLINQETFKDISKEFSTTNGEDTMEILNSKSKEVQDVEENLQWNDIIPMEKQISFGGLKENLLERDTLHGNIHVKNYQEYIYPNSFVPSERPLSTNKDDTELRYTSDTNIPNFTLATNNSLRNRNLLVTVTSNKIDKKGENSEQDIESLYTSDRDTMEDISLSSNNIVISDTSNSQGVKLNLETSNDGPSWVNLYSNQAFTSGTNKDQQDTLETAKNNESYNANNQEDTELLYSVNRMKHLGSVPNYIVTPKTCYNQDIRHTSNTADADNIICVNLTTDKVVTSDIKVKQNTTETLNVTNDNELCNLNNQEDMKTDTATNDDPVCIDLANDEVITSTRNKNLITIEMSDVTNNNELHNANIQKETDQLHTSDNYTMEHIVLTVNLTSDEDVTSDTNENQKSIEKVHISNNNEPDTANNQKGTELLYTNSTQSYTIEDISLTPNYIIPPDTNYNQEDTELSETTNVNETYVKITPNYVFTSNTGNTQEDFISDIMNVYSLIEETLKSNN